MTIASITVKINTQDEALVGADGWNEYDASASVKKLLDNIAAEIRRAYPGVAFEVVGEERFSDQVSVTRTDDDDPRSDELAIGDILSDVYQRLDWFVEA
jgi:hypothetical protein